MTKPILAALLAAPLAACISLSPEPPPSLLTLTPDTPVPGGAAQTADAARSITIVVPVTPQEIATTRVPVQATATSLAYVKDAQWVEQPSRLFARLLSDTISQRTGRIVLDPRQFSLDPGVRLTGELRRFGIDAASSSAVVTYDAALSRAEGQVEKRRFEASVPIAVVDSVNAGQGLNSAANQVAAQVADWIGG
jgi:cholesterol transport system auxiliary component